MKYGIMPAILGLMVACPVALAQKAAASQSARLYVERGCKLFAKGEISNAIADFEVAILFDPTYATAYNDRGIERAALGEIDKALADFERAILLKPNFAAPFYSRGVAQLSLGRVDEAITSLSRATWIDPTFAAAYLNRGVALVLKGQQNEADRDFRTYLTLAPDNRAELEQRLNEAREKWITSAARNPH